MKLLFMTRTPSNRGGQVVLTHLIRELKAQGVQLDLIGFKPEGEPPFEGCEALFEGLDAQIIPIQKHQNNDTQLEEYIHTMAKTLRRIHRQYDKIILDSWYTAAAGILAQLDTAKTVHFVQSDPYFVPESDAEIWKSLFFEMVPYFPFERIVVSKNIQKLFKERYDKKYPHLNLFIADAYHKASFEVKDQPKLRLVSSASDFSLTSKGLDFLLNELNTLENSNFSLTLVAGQPTGRDFNQYHFPVTETTVRTPSEMISILQNHDIYLNTSTNETFCLALAEAITLGMPSIALDSIGNRDYAQGNNFIFVADPTQFSAELKKLFNVEARRALHKNAKQSMAHYSLDTMVEDFKKLIGV